MSGGVPAYCHIVVVVEENKNYDDIDGNPDAPYINSLMTGGANLTNFDALAHPSQPNYFALYAGSTFGATDDNMYSEPDPTLLYGTERRGLTFTGYTETQGDAGACGNDYKRRLLVVDQRDKLGVIVSYDDSEILPTRKPRAVSKALTLDSDVVTARRKGGQKRHPQVVIFAAAKEQMSPHDVSDPDPGLSRAGLPAEDPPDLGAS